MPEIIDMMYRGEEIIPEQLPYDPSQSSWGDIRLLNSLDQRLQKIEDRTISDIDLDNMTKPAGEEEKRQLSPLSEAEPLVPRQQSDQQPQGIGAMQEPDMSSMIPPEVSAALGNGIKNAVKQDPTVDQATKEQIYSLSDNNIGELVGQMLEKGMEIPDEEVSSMSMEKEEEAEGIIDRLMGNETADIASFGHGGAVQQMMPPQGMPFDPNLGQPQPPLPSQGMPMMSQGMTMPPPQGMPKGMPMMPQRAIPSFNQGGPVKQYNLGGIASMGRGGDSQLAHVMPGERMVPPGVVDDGMLDAAFVRAGLDPMEYKVGSSQTAVNPMTGMPEYGLFSFVKRLLKKVKKIAPVIGQIVGFAYGGPMGAGIGKAIGGVLKTGDLDFKDALTDFGTGWAMGNFATGMGMKGGQGFKSIFGRGTGTHIVQQGDTVKSVADQYGITEEALKNANKGARGQLGSELSIPERSMWGWEATAGDPGTVGGFIQSAGSKVAGGLGAPGTMPASLMDEFKNLPMGQKLGVGALGLAALSKTGMFDEEELGDVPPEIQTEMEGLRAYANQGLKPAIQGQWGVGSPTVSTPAIPSHTSFYTPPSQSSSLTEALAELNKTNLRLPSPVFT